jgi:hypothetical protein
MKSTPINPKSSTDLQFPGGKQILGIGVTPTPLILAMGRKIQKERAAEASKGRKSPLPH